MKKRLIHIVSLVLIFTLIPGSIVWAFPPIPMYVDGTVKINGEFVSDGTVVEAWCGGVAYEESTTFTWEGQSYYTLEIPGDDPEASGLDGCVIGEIVSFTVDGYTADQTATWVSGGNENINLTAIIPAPAISLVKLTNDSLVSDPPGLRLLVGDVITWTYQITNTGNVDLVSISLFDDPEGTITCPYTTLVPEDSMTCTETGLAEAGAYTNTATASALFETTVVSDTAASHYFGVDGSLDLEKLINGEDADSAPGVYLSPSDPITWTFTVTNTGNVTLTDVVIVDDLQGGTVCTISTMLPGDPPVSCSMIDSALSGAHTNTAVVTGTLPWSMGTVTDTDLGHYFGAEPAIALQKHTNDFDADSPPGPSILEDTSVAWSYAVLNSGNVPLSGVDVSDDQGVTISCPYTALDPGASMICNASDTAVEGQYENLGTATGTPPGGFPNPEGQDYSHYFGASPAIGVTKTTNGLDGSSILVDMPVTWTYTVTAAGNVPLLEIALVDSQPGVLPVYQSGDLGGDQVLGLGETWVYTATGSAVTGSHTNIVTATAVYTDDLGNVAALESSDGSSYFGADPAVALQKTTNGSDHPFIRVGDPVTWAYTVTNTGNVPLVELSVTDSEAGVSPVYGSGDANSNDFLDLDETWLYSAAGTAQEGAYSNTGTVSASYTDDHGNNALVGAQDGSAYFGANPSVLLEKSTNLRDADSAPGPAILSGTAITWTYAVTNTGNITLTDLSVVDDPPQEIACPVTTLAPFESTDCHATGIAGSTPYTNTATVTATPPVGPDVSDQDSSHYYGASPAITVTVTTNGLDGSSILVGTPVTWTYTVSAAGNVPLVTVSLADDQPGVTPLYQAGDLDSDQVLDLGETWVYTGTGIAEIGEHANTVEATAVYTDDFGSTADLYAADSSAYFGASPAILVQKTTNGSDHPFILAEDPVTWTYTVTNPGNVPLTVTQVTDSDPSVTPVYLSGDLNADEMLDMGESWVYQATGNAVIGAYSNTGTASGGYTDDHGSSATVESHDGSAYFGADPGIDIEKSTNGQDADQPPGPDIRVGDPVDWTYTVTNTGNVTLTAITVLDDPPQEVSCSLTTLAPEQSTTCQAAGTADPGQYGNTVTASGTPPVGPDVSDQDSSHYFGVDPGIALRKLTNGEQAGTAPGPLILVSDTVTWTYQITNTGNSTLIGIQLTDDRQGEIDCPKTTLSSLEGMTCTAADGAIKGQYTNTATVTGNPSVGPAVTAEDTSHYFGAEPAIALQKLTNGQDADTAPGPYILVGETVTWTYQVTNTGNVALTGVSVSDDAGTPGVFADDFTPCEGLTLAASGSTTCESTAVAVEGAYTNTAEVVATPPIGPQVSAGDLNHYYGTRPELVIQKATNGEDADQAPGPFISKGDPVDWTYTVTNTGNITLTGVTVVDDQGITVSCPQGALSKDESMTCTAREKVTLGQYQNIGSVSGFGPVGLAESSDPSHYYGYDPAESLSLEFAVNGNDADSPPGVYILSGEPITWTVTVFNLESVEMVEIAVVDDNGTPGDTGDDILVCTIPSLMPSSQTTCERTGIAGTAQHVHTASASGYLEEVGGTQVSDQDLAHYYGVIPGLLVEKFTNGQDADQPTGPIILEGEVVTWTYVLTNTSNIDLVNVTVTDSDPDLQVSCPGDILTLGEPSMICTATGETVAGQYTNTTTAQAASPDGLVTFNAQDPSHYFGADPAVALETRVNGHDADVAPGVYITAGDHVDWAYVITNTGNITLTEIAVNHDLEVPISCPGPELASGASMTCTAGTNAGEGLNLNTASVQGGYLGRIVSDEDPGYYFGALLGVEIQKSTNGLDAEFPPGPTLLAGTPVTWTYTITNTSNVTLTEIILEDDVEGTVSCPGAVLLKDESMVCQLTGAVEAGQYANLAAVTGTPPGDLGAVSAEDPSHYFGAGPAIDIEKSTNGFDADSPPGPNIPEGDPVTWEYLVVNSGNVFLEEIQVSDDILGEVSCPKTSLDPAEQMVCQEEGLIQLGLYSNLGKVSATYSLYDVTVSNSDPSHYNGVPRYRVYLPLVIR